MRKQNQLSKEKLCLLMVSALGVVYGDIGTSPLYALRECFYGPHAIILTPENILGILSLIFWSLVAIISVKYMVFVLQADNRGEGGILALMALAGIRSKIKKKWPKFFILILGIFGASLLFGDGIITPAISVLSAVEGLQVAAPALAPFVQGITILILIILFLIQYTGTARIGLIFGPFMLLWFIALGSLGVAKVIQVPEVLWALHPGYMVQLFHQNFSATFIVLGSVFLVVTGGEALYADLGHFGKIPIRKAWFFIALPGLLFNYFGQGALLLKDPQAVENPFYHLVPDWFLYPMIGIATLASIIASQAVISGVFSLIRQATQLGYFPRVTVVHTSEQIGQIYIPIINWVLFLSAVWLVINFKTSSNLASAYGVAVSTDMTITTCLVAVVAARLWRWNQLLLIPVIGTFLFIDFIFLGSNLLKIQEGGWVPFLIGGVMATLMTTWKRGREILAERMIEKSISVEQFLKEHKTSDVKQVSGTSVFLTGDRHGTPSALIHNVKHNKVIHERVLLLTIKTEEVPWVPMPDRVSIEKLSPQIYRIISYYGFKESPNIPDLLAHLHSLGIPCPPEEITYFLGRETIIPTTRPGMALWREKLFSWMSQNSQPATKFFKIPPDKVIEVGIQVEL